MILVSMGGIVALATLFWFFSTRATFIMVAVVGGFLAHGWGLHWVSIILVAFGFFAAFSVLLFALGALSARFPYLIFLQIVLVSGIPFGIGFANMRKYMLSPDQGASEIEAAIGGFVAGVVLAVAAYRGYLRDSQISPLA